MTAHRTVVEPIATDAYWAECSCGWNLGESVTSYSVAKYRADMHMLDAGVGE